MRANAWESQKDRDMTKIDVVVNSRNNTQVVINLSA
jgi:hypothetical protein